MGTAGSELGLLGCPETWGICATLQNMGQNRPEGSIRSKELDISLESSFILLRREACVGKGRENCLHLTVRIIALLLLVASRHLSEPQFSHVSHLAGVK